MVKLSMSSPTLQINHLPKQEWEEWLSPKWSHPSPPTMRGEKLCNNYHISLHPKYHHG